MLSWLADKQQTANNVRLKYELEQAQKTEEGRRRYERELARQRAERKRGEEEVVDLFKELKQYGLLQAYQEAGWMGKVKVIERLRGLQDDHSDSSSA